MEDYAKLWQRFSRHFRENGIDGGFLKGEGGSSLLSIFFTRKHNDITGYISTAYRRNKLEYVSKVDNFQIWQHFQ